MEFFTGLNQSGDWGLLALRLAVGAIFLAHGLSKRKMWKMRPSEQMPAGMLNQMKLLSIIEPLGGLAVLLGLFTQLGALALGIVMLGAIYMKKIKWQVPFTASDKMGWEFDLILLTACLLLLLMGAGGISLDSLLFGV
ncbi:MAG TPA: DoxX family protein [Patescibacteria group bacterium]